MNATGPVLEASGLHRTFGSGAAAVHAVAGVDLELHDGELVALWGRSGAGKTTLLRMLGGLDVPDAGEVRVLGRGIAGLDADALVELRRREVGFVFQTFELIPVLSAAENVEVPLRVVGTPVAERDARVRELLDHVGLGGHAEQRPSELSGGQQQRVAIARALANRPRVLLADEPTGQLDHATGTAVMQLIAGLVHESGLAALVATHDPRIAAMADRTVELRDGKLAGAVASPA